MSICIAELAAGQCIMPGKQLCLTPCLSELLSNSDVPLRVFTHLCLTCTAALSVHVPVLDLCKYVQVEVQLSVLLMPCAAL